MEKKIGRNDPCYCGSGKKYKKCCLTKEMQPKSPWKEYPEEYVLKELLDGSERFKKYYTRERPKIKDPIKWVEDIHLPVGIDYRTTILSLREKVIRLRKIPATLEDSTKIAHELQHLVMHYEGFAQTGATVQYETISSSLNSIVHDLIVNERLIRYDFDLMEDYKREKQESIRQLSKIDKSPIDNIGKFHWACNYVSHVLDCELIFGSDVCKEDEFLCFFKRKYPEIVKESSELLRIIKDNGYDRPEKQIKLFKETIAAYKLEAIIFI